MRAPHRLLAVALAVQLTGCGFLFGDEGVFPDRSRDYRKAREMPVMELPEGTRSESLAEIYAIPEVTAEPDINRSDRVPRPAPLVSASADQLVRIQRLGTDSWALIAIAPGQLWPQLRSFLTAANIEVARMDARAGIIESEYLDLRGQELPSRFRFRVERGVQRGNSELHILQMHPRTDDTWPEDSDDVELEAELLRGVAQFIANSADTAPVSMMAEQSISASGKVTIEEADGEQFIQLDLPFDRGWASLARALELSNFEITDRNRSEGRYYVAFQNDDEEKSGWFGWLSGGGDEHPAAGVPLILSSRQVADERMEIRLRPEEGGAVSDEDLEALLVLIKGNIN